MKKLLPIVSILAVVLILGAAGSTFAQSCPMCKESMTEAGKKLSEGFYYSILSLAFLPMSLVGSVAVFVVRTSYVKKHPDTTLSTFGIIRQAIKDRFFKR